MRNALKSARAEVLPESENVARACDEHGLLCSSTETHGGMEQSPRPEREWNRLAVSRHALKVGAHVNSLPLPDAPIGAAVDIEHRPPTGLSHESSSDYRTAAVASVPLLFVRLARSLVSKHVDRIEGKKVHDFVANEVNARQRQHPSTPMGTAIVGNGNVPA